MLLLFAVLVASTAMSIVVLVTVRRLIFCILSLALYRDGFNNSDTIIY